MPVKVKATQGQGKASKTMSAQQLFEQAQLALQYDEVEEALDLMRKSMRLEPDNVEVKHGRVRHANGN